MMKNGILVNKRTGLKYIVVSDAVQNKGERIEIYNRIEDYTPMHTYDAISAYFRKSREYVYGNPQLIKDYLETKNSCTMISGQINQSSGFTPEGFVIVQSKKSESLGKSYSVKLVNGIIAEEEYITPEFNLFLKATDSFKTEVFIEPLNLKNYKVINILSDFDDMDNLDADYYSLDYLKSRYDIDHLDDYDYRIVESEEEAREMLTRWANAPVKLKSIDVESTGLDVSIFGEDLITGVVMSYDWVPLGEVENSVYFPFRQKMFEYNLPIEFLKEISDVVASQKRASSVDPNVNDGTLLLAHNAKMEIKSFWQDGLDLTIDADTYTLSTLIDTKMERGLHTLKNRANQVTGLTWLELDMIFKSKVIRFDILPPDIVRAYACADTPNTIKVFKYLMARLPREEYYVFETESRLQRCKANNEFYGLRVNQEDLLKRIENVEYVTNRLADEFKKWHHTSKNINSADVLRDIIYNKLNCTVVVRTKKKKPSTSKDAVKNIVDRNIIRNVDLEHDVSPDFLDKFGRVVIKGTELKSNRYPSLVLLSNYNKYKKELGSLNRLLKKSNKDRLMFGINGTGAASNRQTSDAHQMSDSMKEVVLADTPYHTLASADYSQVELRVLAYIIGDKRLIELMKDKHNDIHRVFLSTINNIPIHLISAKMRSNGKRVNFGVVYGISEYGLARDIYGPMYTKEELLTCSKSITDFYNGIPKCKDLSNYNRKYIFEHGYIKTKFGYRRIIYNALDPDLDKQAREKVFRAANNTPVQGFAAHLMKLAEINFDNYIANKGWDKTIEYMGKQFPLVRIMLSIHDEVLISAHESIPKEEIVVMCKECMEIEIDNAPPFFAVPAFVDNWLQGKSDQYDMSISMRDDILEAWKDGHRSIVDWNDMEGSINRYKNSQIKEYMDGLIRKYGSADNVIPHVDHPEYTHLLIAVYVPKDVIKRSTQEECIAFGVRAYMEGNPAVVEDEVTYNEFVEDSSILDSFSYLDEFSKYVEVSETGECLVEENIDSDLVEDEDEEDLQIKQDLEDEEKFSKVTLGVLYIGNIIMIDTSEIADEYLRDFNSEVSALCNRDGYYSISYMRGSKVIDASLRMDPRQRELEDIFNKYAGRSVE